MKGMWHIILGKFMIGLLILVMGCLLVNQAIFTHTHVQADGSLVSHAHPFSKKTDNAKGKAHQHSSLEIILLEQLDVLISCASALVLLKALSMFTTFRPEAIQVHLPSLTLPSSGRAPPASM